MIHKLFTLILSLLLLNFCANNQLQAQNINGSYNYDGLEREYILHIPATYDAQIPTPLILALHGLGDTNSNFMAGTGFNAMADTANFIIVYPQAIVDGLFGAAWNNGAGSFGITLNGDVDDVGFLSSLIDSIDASYNVATEQVYATGFSMGGIMTHKLGCDLNNRLAAIASVAGPMPDASAGNCTAENPIPVMHLHGTGDATVAYEDGGFNGFDAGLMGAEESIDFWTNFNGCTTTPLITNLPDIANDGYSIEKYEYAPCEEATEVILYKIANAPHTWLQPGNDVFASEEIWNFFRKHQNENTVTTPTAINEITSKEILKVYPNPSTSIFNIQINKPTTNIKSMQLINTAGQTVWQANATNGNAIQTPMLIDVDLPKGTYILQYVGEQENGQMKIMKL